MSQGDLHSPPAQRRGLTQGLQGGSGTCVCRAPFLNHSAPGSSISWEISTLIEASCQLTRPPSPSPLHGNIIKKGLTGKRLPRCGVFEQDRAAWSGPRPARTCRSQRHGVWRGSAGKTNDTLSTVVYLRRDYIRYHPTYTS